MQNAGWKLRGKIYFNRWAMVGMDALVVFLSYLGAYWLRFEGAIVNYGTLINATYLPLLAIKLIFFYIFGMYRGMWRYTSMRDLQSILLANIIASSANLTWFFFTERAMTVYRSVVILDGLLTLLGVTGIRLAVRIIFQYHILEENPVEAIFRRRTRKRLLIIGAGDSGEKVLREMHDNKNLAYEVVGFLDDNPAKHRRLIHGVPILGATADLGRIIHQKNAEEILIAVPSASSREMRRVVELCEQTGLPCRTLPGIGELIDGSVHISSIRNVSYEDLMGREAVRLDMDRIGKSLAGRRILVTGAGGSIGSELCRQLARFQPELLVMLDRTENNLFHVEMEMRRLFPDLNLRAELADIQKGAKIYAIFQEVQPQVVFHAAAFKHVPLMELHPWEAVNNNVFGTANVIRAAANCNVARFVNVSTDKAVRPTNVMGATKRVAELLTVSQDHGSMRCMAVRFGNVVGSEGSVIPLFKKQIERGGPVTVTHPEVTRFFMTIPEAAQLILQAAAMGEGGEIFILKMGNPIRIVDLARDLIRLSGYEPDEEIEIRFTGLRPGEKLYEELITEGEGIISTEHEKILVLRAQTIQPDEINPQLRALRHSAFRRNPLLIKDRLKDLVPDYQPDPTG